MGVWKRWRPSGELPSITRRRCVVFLANDVRAERIYPALAAFILGETVLPWGWEYAP